MTRFLHRCLALFNRNRVEDELAREMASHFALLEDEYLRRGLSRHLASIGTEAGGGGTAA